MHPLVQKKLAYRGGAVNMMVDIAYPQGPIHLPCPGNSAISYRVQG